MWCMSRLLQALRHAPHFLCMHSSATQNLRVTPLLSTASKSCQRSPSKTKRNATKELTRKVSDLITAATVCLKGRTLITLLLMPFFLCYSFLCLPLWFRTELVIHHPVHRGHIPPNHPGDSVCLLETFQVGAVFYLPPLLFQYFSS